MVPTLSQFGIDTKEVTSYKNAIIHATELGLGALIVNWYRALDRIQPHRHPEGPSCVAGNVNRVNSKDLDKELYRNSGRRNAMRLATRALIAALATLVLCAAVSAQTLRSPNDARNQSPSVGTGGPEGGPTGLFTIYDGATIRKGEFTFSLAYSNYDRDQGNVDITDRPASFNLGLNDHIEVFFRTNLYRGIKVNSPANLSGFYMPNVSLCSALSPCIGPAIILAPSGPNVGTLAGNAIFLPLNNQPFVGFPYIGSSAVTFGQGPG